MLLAELRNIKKYYAERLILDIEDFKIYSGEKIGLVGRNGSGKTTFLEVLLGLKEKDEGFSKIYREYSYISQLGDMKDEVEIDKISKKFKVSNISNENPSGGEVARLKISQAFQNDSELLICDEPTSNLDIEGILVFQEELKKYRGGAIIVSHDRELLDQVCEFILEIEDGKLKKYRGNYSKYLELKELEREREGFLYDEYLKEKKRLKQAVTHTANESKSVRKAPKRMGNSEARLHKMGDQGAKFNLDKKAKALKTRIEKLEERRKPSQIAEVKISLKMESNLYNKVLFESENLTKAVATKLLFEEASFKVENKKRTALLGENGSGKTTLLNMIIGEDDSIKRASGLKIGYFSQDLSILDEDKTILQNLMENSHFDETFVRILLARLLFRRDDVHKKVSVLSGGERVKIAIGKIMVMDFNVLVLDEPTNYLDIESIESVENAIKAYEGAVFFVSHDRRFVENVAQEKLLIRDKKIIRQ